MPLRQQSPSFVNPMFTPVPVHALGSAEASSLAENLKDQGRNVVGDKDGDVTVTVAGGGNVSATGGNTVIGDDNGGGDIGNGDGDVTVTETGGGSANVTGGDTVIGDDNGGQLLSIHNPSFTTSASSFASNSSQTIAHQLEPTAGVLGSNSSSTTGPLSPLFSTTPTLPAEVGATRVDQVNLKAVILAAVIPGVLLFIIVGLFIRFKWRRLRERIVRHRRSILIDDNSSESPLNGRRSNSQGTSRIESGAGTVTPWLFVTRGMNGMEDRLRSTTPAHPVVVSEAAATRGEPKEISQSGPTRKFIHPHSPPPDYSYNL